MSGMRECGICVRKFEFSKDYKKGISTVYVAKGGQKYSIYSNMEKGTVDEPDDAASR